jgi:hypothetical protein
MDAGISEYWLGPMYRWMVIGLSAVGILVGFVAGIVGAANGSGLAVLVGVVVLLMNATVLVLWLVVFADRLQTDGVVLRWEGVLRSGEWRVADVSSVALALTGVKTVRLRNSDGRSLLVSPQKGWSDFLVALNPSCGVDPAATEGFLRLWPGSSSFHRRADW